MINDIEFMRQMSSVYVALIIGAQFILLSGIGGLILHAVADLDKLEAEDEKRYEEDN